MNNLAERGSSPDSSTEQYISILEAELAGQDFVRMSDEELSLIAAQYMCAIRKDFPNIFNVLAQLIVARIPRLKSDLDALKDSYIRELRSHSPSAQDEEDSGYVHLTD
jgi:hypothetical protein